MIGAMVRIAKESNLPKVSTDNASIKTKLWVKNEKIGFTGLPFGPDECIALGVAIVLVFILGRVYIGVNNIPRQSIPLGVVGSGSPEDPFSLHESDNIIGIRN